MDKIDLLAHFQPYEEFRAKYDQLTVAERNAGDNLLIRALGNKDLDARYDISNFLLDEGYDAAVVTSEGDGTLQVLLAQQQNDIPRVTALCRRLIEGGADVNLRDKQNTTLWRRVIFMWKFKDAELQPLYDLLFEQPNLDLDSHPDPLYNGLGVARKFSDTRGDLVRQMEEYLAARKH